MTRQRTFSAQVRAWTNQTKADMLYVAAEAIQDVMEAAQTPQLGVTKGASGFVEGKIPVAEGDLIQSLTSNGTVGADSYVAVISNMKLGDKLTFAWTAEYALAIELGTSTIQGRHFVGKNVARFAEFVEKRVREVRR